MKKKLFPIAYIIAIVVGLIMVSLTVWQFTLPETNPLAVMGILCGGGMLACFVVALHRMNNSYTPFQAASLPLGVMLIWVAVVLLGCGIWEAVIRQNNITIIVVSIVFVILCLMGYKILKD